MLYLQLMSTMKTFRTRHSTRYLKAENVLEYYLVTVAMPVKDGYYPRTEKIS